MRTIISRWFLFGLLLGWSLTHATVFGQPAGKTSDKATAADKLRANLDKNVTLDFSGQSLTEVLNHFRDKTGITLHVDQVALMQIGIDMGGGIPGGFFPPGGAAPMQPQLQLKATNEKASQVLRKLLNSHQLTYILFEDAVLVTTEEIALMRQMRQRVSVDLDEVPFNKAVRSLAKSHGINLVIDPKVAKQAEAPVSLQLESTGLETAVRLLAELANLKSVRMGNVMFITTPEKAEKIRKEEPQQLDNPFNPNMPVGPPMLRGGGFGGVMPMPARVGPALPPQGIPNLVPPPPGIELEIAPKVPKQAPPIPR